MACAAQSWRRNENGLAGIAVYDCRNRPEFNGKAERGEGHKEGEGIPMCFHENAEFCVSWHFGAEVAVINR